MIAQLLSLRQGIVVAFATAVLLFCTGCKHSNEPAEPAEIPLAALESLRGDAGSEQLAMLQDGQVTFEEYEQATLATVKCISDSGIKTGKVELKFRGKYYRYDWEIPGDRADELFPKLDACLVTWRPIEDAWYIENTPSETELEAARRDLVDCMQKSGLEVSEHPTQQELDRFRASPSRAFMMCASAVAEEHGLPGFAG